MTRITEKKAKERLCNKVYGGEIMIECSGDKRVDLYIRQYKGGLCTLGRLKEIYRDYQSKESLWRHSEQYTNFLCGQAVLKKAIERIESG